MTTSNNFMHPSEPHQDRERKESTLPPFFRDCPKTVCTAL